MTDQHGKICGHVRKCDEHGEHGTLYPCPMYDQATLDAIAESTAQHIANLRDPAWCQKQVDDGLPPEGIAIFRALAGLDIDGNVMGAQGDNDAR